MEKCAYAHLAMGTFRLFTFKILFHVSDALVIIIVILILMISFYLLLFCIFFSLFIICMLLNGCP